MMAEGSRETTQGAMLAFAVGDALGWPVEKRGNRVGGSRGLRPELTLRGWTRREGGGYAPHEEAMPAGVYSDDTQLTLAVARAMAHGDWWYHLTAIELPWWTQYELGGGGAVKRAAQSWSKGTPPWRADGARGYWTAGGNGAAMRVLPHCVLPGESFDVVRRRVLADAAATHGDPIALVGAQLYASVLWTTVRRKAPLAWAELLDESLEEGADWHVFEPEVVPGDWPDGLPPGYSDQWAQTVKETQRLLRDARNQMEHGALTVDDEVLRGLGLFSSSGGAGVLTAVGALYLASRHAANPEHGLLRAAFARGADTDTLAAMTGALLGAVHGYQWLGATARQVMDAELLANVLSQPRAAGRAALPRCSRGAQREVEALLRDAEVGTVLDLPFFGRVEVVSVRDLDNRKSWIRSWWFRNGEGQTFRFKKISRAERPPWNRLHAPLRKNGTESATRANELAEPTIRSGLVLRVMDVQRAKDFYERLLGMPVTRETKAAVTLGGWLALESAGEEGDRKQTRLSLVERHSLAVTLFAPETQFAALEGRLHSSRVDFEVRSAEGTRVLVTQDPDGTPVEVRLRSS